MTRWTPVAVSDDVPAATVAPGRLGDHDLAIWRSASGRIAVWSDRCPHRGMRLSHGFVRGEALSCIYHGWSYGASGACRKIPAHPDLVPPEAIRVPAFSAIESAGLVWACESDAPPAPPEVPGLTALREIEVARPPDAVARALGGGDASAPLDFGPDGAVALLQPRRDGCTGVYVLVPETLPGTGRRAVSDAMERLRRRIEGGKEQAA